MRRLLLCSTVALLLVPVALQAMEETATVVRVADGGILLVRIADREEQVRLIGVDTPDSIHAEKPVEFFGREAAEFTRRLVEGKTVILRDEPGGLDRDGVLQRYVFLEDGTLVNAEIIKQGYGHADLKYPFSRMEEFRAYERQAQDEGAGQWGLLRNTDVKYDASRGITWYLPMSERGRTIDLANGSTLDVYARFGIEDDGTRILRLEARRRGKHGIHVNALRFVIDGQDTTIRLDPVDDVRTVDSGTVVEETVSVGNQDDLIDKIISGERVDLYLVGAGGESHYKLSSHDLEGFERIRALSFLEVLPPLESAVPDVVFDAEAGVRGGVAADELESPLYAGIGGVTNPELISKVNPRYPEKARKEHVQGRVVLRAICRKDGSVDNIEVLRSPGKEYGFDEAVSAAVRRWRYKPATLNGEPVDVYFTVIVNFVVQEK